MDLARIVIRPAVEADLPVIATVMHEAFAGFIPLTGQAPQPLLEDHSERIAKGESLVLLEDEKIVGVAVLVTEGDAPLLRTVAVLPERQSAGHARRLIAFAEEAARRRGADEIHVVVHVTMAKAIRLYRALGYEESGRAEQEGYYRVFMKRRLG
jgi:ribosomal protein S18 acetylase RimI-like enzyme